MRSLLAGEMCGSVLVKSQTAAGQAYRTRNPNIGGKEELKDVDNIDAEHTRQTVPYCQTEFVSRREMSAQCTL